MTQTAINLHPVRRSPPLRNARGAVNVPDRPGPREDGTTPVPLDRLLAAGKALRAVVPRPAHAAWKRNMHRADPIDILRAGDAGRLKDLVPIRYGRMLQSPFAFYRGSAAIMAADLASTPITGIRVQACGDCHLVNFGGFATPERNLVFDINDFDETLPAPWEWDIKRLVASFVLAARANGLSDEQGRETAAVAARSYRKTLRDFAAMRPIDVWYAHVTMDELLQDVPKARRAQARARIKKVAARSQQDIAFPKLVETVDDRVAIRDTPPLIFHPEITRAPGFRRGLARIYAAYRETLAHDRRVLLDQYHMVDAAIKVVGIGSVGRVCAIALLISARGDPLFLQFKEAVPSVLEPYAGKSAYAHHGQRVVVGQRLMQPASDVFLGWVTAKGEERRRQYYVRQLRDAKIKPLVETYDAEMLALYAKACGRVLARAHAKSGAHYAIGGYLGSSGPFDEAMADFAIAYANQAERDFAALKAAVRNGKIAVHRE